MELVAYIVESQNGRFHAFISALVPDDTDSALFVQYKGKKSDDLEEVQDFLVNNSPEGAKEIYLNPIKSSEDGLSWLSELEAANPQPKTNG